jgi:hypothetical protein
MCNMYTSTLRLPWPRIFRAFSSVVRQKPGLHSQRPSRTALFQISCYFVVISLVVLFCCFCVVLLQFVLFCYYLCCSVYCKCVLYHCHRVFTQLLLTSMSICFSACFSLGPSNAERKAPVSFVVSVCPSFYITWRQLWNFFPKKIWYWRLLNYPYSSSKFGYNRTRMSVSLLQNLSNITLLTAALNVLYRNSNDKEIQSCLPWQNSTISNLRSSLMLRSLYW